MDQINKPKILLAFLAVGIFTLVVLGLIWFFFLGPTIPVGLGWYLFSFAAGLSMIVLPCTLPLAFVIVPLSMGKGAAKGFGIALSFGMGVALTLSAYGVLAAILGEVAIGTLGAPLEVVKNWLYLIAGIFAYLFAMGELGLIKFRMPTYSGAAPAFIQKQKDYLKALLLGLFLGNVGVGCPHPATPVILTRIAASGDIFYGWLLFFVHALGRVLPLLLLALLAILGVNALSWLVARKDKVEKATGWGMVFVAGFILVLGLFTHDWWVYSGQHTLLEDLTSEEKFLGIIVNRFNLAEPPHAHGIPTGLGLFGLPLWLGNWALALLWIIPAWWYYARKKKEVELLSEPEKTAESKTISIRLLLNIVFTLFIVITFVYYLPLRFVYNVARPHQDTEQMMKEGTMMQGEEHVKSNLIYHEEKDITAGLAVNFNIFPMPVLTGIQEKLNFFVNNKPENSPVPISDLEISKEKAMHVIGVRSDMNEFFHIHPAQAHQMITLGDGKKTQTLLQEIPGTLTADHIFSKPGNYKIWSEVTKGGVDHVFGHAEFSVDGYGVREEKEVDLSRIKTVNGHQVTLGADKVLVKGKNQVLSLDIHDSAGGEVELENYLGVPVHLTIIKDDLKQFIHTHPVDGRSDDHASFSIFTEAFAHGEEEDGHDEEKSMPASLGSEHGVGFQVVFSEAGLYKAFAQFRPKEASLSPEETLTAAFWVQVEEKEPLPLSPWWINLIWSAAAIVVLSWLVKKYLKAV